MSSPEATLASFFQALGKKRIPGDLTRFIIATHLLREWQFRCRKGCFDGTYKIVRRTNETPSKAIQYVDFVIRIGDGRKLRATAQPVILDKLADQWLIGDFGKRFTKKMARPSPSSKAARDAAP